MALLGDMSSGLDNAGTLGGLDDGVSLPSGDLQMLGLQQRMMKENEIYQMLSNIMKMRHDGHMNAISNMK